MAYFTFTKAILEGRPIDVYNYGHLKLDFTYIDDIVEGIGRVLDRPPTVLGPSSVVMTRDGMTKVESTPTRGGAPYRLHNIGNHTPVDLLFFIEVLEKALGKKAVKNLLPMQPGDVVETFADVSALVRDVGFSPSTPIEVGIQRFVDWYRDYYHVPRKAEVKVE
jgi:UDP-glucuronate 4-epimerase